MDDLQDPSNLRSPQRHTGVVHSSNLCTEILLNTNKDEIAVCNLGSINLVAHVKDRKLNEALIESTVITAMRMLDNVIDLNYYPVPQARNSNLKHRPVGMGIMGFQDALYATGVSYASEGARRVRRHEHGIHLVLRDPGLLEAGQERGSYPSYRVRRGRRVYSPSIR